MNKSFAAVIAVSFFALTAAYGAEQAPKGNGGYVYGGYNAESKPNVEVVNKRTSMKKLDVLKGIENLNQWIEKKIDSAI